MLKMTFSFRKALGLLAVLFLSRSSSCRAQPQLQEEDTAAAVEGTANVFEDEYSSKRTILDPFQIVMEPLDKELTYQEQLLIRSQVEKVLSDYLIEQYDDWPSSSTIEVIFVAVARIIAIRPVENYDSEARTTVISGATVTFDGVVYYDDASQEIPSPEALLPLVANALTSEALVPALQEFFPSITAVTLNQNVDLSTLSPTLSPPTTTLSPTTTPTSPAPTMPPTVSPTTTTTTAPAVGSGGGGASLTSAPVNGGASLTAAPVAAAPTLAPTVLDTASPTTTALATASPTTAPVVEVVATSSPTVVATTTVAPVLPPTPVSEVVKDPNAAEVGNSNNDDTGMIVGATIGGLLVVGAMLLVTRQRQQRQQQRGVKVMEELQDDGDNDDVDADAEMADHNNNSNNNNNNNNMDDWKVANNHKDLRLLHQEEIIISPSKSTTTTTLTHANSSMISNVGSSGSGSRMISLLGNDDDDDDDDDKDVFYNNDMFIHDDDVSEYEISFTKDDGEEEEEDESNHSTVGGDASLKGLGILGAWGGFGMGFGASAGAGAGSNRGHTSVSDDIEPHLVMSDGSGAEDDSDNDQGDDNDDDDADAQLKDLEEAYSKPTKRSPSSNHKPNNNGRGGGGGIFRAFWNRGGGAAAAGNAAGRGGGAERAVSPTAESMGSGSHGGDTNTSSGQPGTMIHSVESFEAQRRQHHSHMLRKDLLESPDLSVSAALTDYRTGQALAAALADEERYNCALEPTDVSAASLAINKARQKQEKSQQEQVQDQGKDKKQQQAAAQVDSGNSTDSSELQPPPTTTSGDDDLSGDADSKLQPPPSFSTLRRVAPRERQDSSSNGFGGIFKFWGNKPSGATHPRPLPARFANNSNNNSNTANNNTLLGRGGRAESTDDDTTFDNVVGDWDPDDETSQSDLESNPDVFDAIVDNKDEQSLLNHSLKNESYKLQRLRTPPPPTGPSALEGRPQAKLAPVPPSSTYGRRIGSGVPGHVEELSSTISVPPRAGPFVQHVDSGADSSSEDDFVL